MSVKMVLSCLVLKVDPEKIWKHVIEQVLGSVDRIRSVDLQS